MRDCRQKTSASWYAALPSSRRAIASRRTFSARTHTALIANSSAPMSTIRPRKPCLVSMRPCQRDMA